MSCRLVETPKKGVTPFATPETSSRKLARESIFPLQNMHLICDDYITLFFLRLFLYDPIKYEYKSPIVPVPKNLCIGLLGSQDWKDHDSHAVSDIDFQTVTLPFIVCDPYHKLQRSVEDLVELNILLEALYLSYRNEMKPTIDNDTYWLSKLKNQNEISNSDSHSNSLASCFPSSDTQLSNEVDKSKHDYDGKEKSHQNESTSNCPNYAKFSDRLRKMKVESRSMTAENKELSFTEPINVDCEDNHILLKLKETVRIQSEYFASRPSPFTQNHLLRKELANKLHPLLNGYQNWLVCQILEAKE